MDKKGKSRSKKEAEYNFQGWNFTEKNGEDVSQKSPKYTKKDPQLQQSLPEDFWDDTESENIVETHWVEELFPPTFGLTLNELKTGLRENETPEATVFEKVAHGISPLDTSAIKNVYERVWLMTYLEDEERKKREQDESEFGVQTEAFQRSSTPIGTLTTTQPPSLQTVTGPVARSLRSKNIQACGSEIDKESPIDIDDSCIWSSKEIEVLRAVFRSARDQNVKLRARLQESTEHGTKLELQSKKQTQILEKRSNKLMEASKANERLHIMCESMKSQVNKLNHKVEVLSEELESLKGVISKDNKDAHELRLAFDHERLDRKKVECELQAQQREALLELQRQEEVLKMEQQDDIAFLQKKIADLQKENEKEKSDHRRTRKGLEHLQNHFASLPMFGESKGPNTVTSDQLKTWSY